VTPGFDGDGGGDGGGGGDGSDGGVVVAGIDDNVWAINNDRPGIAVSNRGRYTEG